MGTTDDNLELSLRVEWLEEQVRLIKDRYTILSDSAQNLQIGNSVCQMGNDVGCAFCNEENEEFVASMGISCTPDGEVLMRITTHEWDLENGGLLYEQLHVSFCPICGRKLRGV